MVFVYFFICHALSLVHCSFEGDILEQEWGSSLKKTHSLGSTCSGHTGSEL